MASLLLVKWPTDVKLVRRRKRVQPYGKIKEPDGAMFERPAWIFGWSGFVPEWPEAVRQRRCRDDKAVCPRTRSRCPPGPVGRSGGRDSDGSPAEDAVQPPKGYSA